MFMKLAGLVLHMSVGSKLRCRRSQGRTRKW